ncbi:uncharacterized protein K452DRAFT_306980 [Aplosporella prunicola CBS 121167]|uniref:Uncharacterized protein n=1 Tax=Aplosporella prunicola CBS 121167 TaxID=1176127 RepID=A0A6A6BJW3_9PEZI|nr:uncharacterized protein K452DRAFT_306980 [Aplosporella prunicola CBS 121167]KAF2143584.1 hypothetical protein K452DRAFT_306980 [Aplosporella prunicola CBS 121167]
MSSNSMFSATIGRQTPIPFTPSSPQIQRQTTTQTQHQRQQPTMSEPLIALGSRYNIDPNTGAVLVPLATVIQKVMTYFADTNGINVKGEANASANISNTGTTSTNHINYNSDNDTSLGGTYSNPIAFHSTPPHKRKRERERERERDDYSEGYSKYSPRPSPLPFPLQKRPRASPTAYSPQGWRFPSHRPDTPPDETRWHKTFPPKPHHPYILDEPLPAPQAEVFRPKVTLPSETARSSPEPYERYHAQEWEEEVKEEEVKEEEVKEEEVNVTHTPASSSSEPFYPQQTEALPGIADILMGLPNTSANFSPVDRTNTPYQSHPQPAQDAEPDTSYVRETKHFDRTFPPCQSNTCFHRRGAAVSSPFDHYRSYYQPAPHAESRERLDNGRYQFVRSGGLGWMEERTDERASDDVQGYETYEGRVLTRRF